MAFPAVKFNLPLILHGTDEEGPGVLTAFFPPMRPGVAGEVGGPGINNVSL